MSYFSAAGYIFYCTNNRSPGFNSIFFIILNVSYLKMKFKVDTTSEITVLPEFILFEREAVCL